MTPDEFPTIFEEGWALPKPQPFLEFFLPLIAPDAVFIQPTFRPAHGRVQIQRTFRRLFTLYPDLVAVPQRSAARGDTVYIESICTTRLGGSQFSFAVCDRFVIRDGLLAERRSYTDPGPAVRALLRHPTAWPRAIRSWFA